MVRWQSAKLFYVGSSPITASMKKREFKVYNHTIPKPKHLIPFKYSFNPLTTHKIVFDIGEGAWTKIFFPKHNLRDAFNILQEYSFFELPKPGKTKPELRKVALAYKPVADQEGLFRVYWLETYKRKKVFATRSIELFEGYEETEYEVYIDVDPDIQSIEVYMNPDAILHVTEFLYSWNHMYRAFRKPQMHKMLTSDNDFTIHIDIQKTLPRWQEDLVGT